MRRWILVLVWVLTLASPNRADEPLRQIEIEAQFVEFNMDDIDMLLREAAVNTNALAALRNGLMALRKAGKSRLLAAPRVVTKDDSEAAVKGVTEYIYPTEFTVQTGAHESTDGIAGSTNASPGIVSGLVVPSVFETREVGARLDVFPDGNAEGSGHLVASPQYVCESTCEDYDPKGTNAIDIGQEACMEPPFFHTYADNQIAIRNGATVMIGGMCSPDGKKTVYIFVSARLIDGEGQPLKRK